MSDLSKDLMEILRTQNEAYARAFQAGRDVGYREGFRDGKAAGTDHVREMLAPPCAEPES